MTLRHLFVGAAGLAALTVAACQPAADETATDDAMAPAAEDSMAPAADPMAEDKMMQEDKMMTEDKMAQDKMMQEDKMAPQ